MIGRATRAPDVGPYLALGALVAGVAGGERLGPGPGTGPIIGGLSLLAGALVARRRVRVVLLVAMVTCAGAALVQRSLDGLAHWPLAPAVARRSDATIDATLVDDPDGSRFTSQALVRLRRARLGGRRGDPGWRDAGGRTLLVVAEGDAAPRLAVLAAGDRVRLRGWLRPIDGFDSRFRWRHAVARFDATELVDFSSPEGVLAPVANTVRATVLRGTATLPPTERALVAGFLLGDTRALPDPVLERFRAAGLSHLLAVSGANVAFVLVLAGPMLRRLPRTARLLMTLLVLTVFGAMTRWEPSVLRACAMAACAVAAVHVGRPARATRTLAFAATVLIAVDPFLLHSVGFLLSCGASLGIAVLGPVFAARLRGPAWLREGLATTAAAQVGVAPVLLPVFGSMPLVALPANLLAVPLAGPLTTWGLAASAVGGVLGPTTAGLTRALQLPTQLLADGVLGIADAAARFPVALDVGGWALVIAFAGLALLVGRGRMLRRHALVVPPR